MSSDGVPQISEFPDPVSPVRITGFLRLDRAAVFHMIMRTLLEACAFLDFIRWQVGHGKDSSNAKGSDSRSDETTCDLPRVSLSELLLV